jgi:hypothetical protein
MVILLSKTLKGCLQMKRETRHLKEIKSKESSFYLFVVDIKSYP